MRLRVFGLAMAWAGQARDALVAALSSGISIKSGSRHQVAFAPHEVLTEIVDGIERVDVTRDASLVFRSPLVVRSRSSAGTP
ncbi:MAG: hypothetical protein F9K29_02540 [Hyphomicrobiaceae bacterium]|nr:MAG: hypothetical protein F9K29_02540 [Hyphomicrobiaceae bacterium]